MKKSIVLLTGMFIMGSPALHAQVWFNALATIEDIIREMDEKPFYNIDIVNSDGLTGLMYAVKHGYLDRVKLFLERGANVHLSSFDKDKNSPLHLAFQFDNDTQEPIAYQLLAYGANPNARNSGGKMPAHFLVMWVQQEPTRLRILQALLDKRANINIQDANGDTMLHIATDLNLISWVALLKQYYASLVNFNLINKFGRNPIQLADDHGLGDMEAELVDVVPPIGSNGDIAARDHNGRTGLMAAIYRMDVDFAQRMINLHSNVNAQDNKGDTPLHYACMSGAPEAFVQMLLANKAQPEIANHDGDTPLMFVINIDNPVEKNTVTQSLIKAGAKINTFNKRGETIVSRAVHAHDTALISTLKQLDKTFKGSAVWSAALDDAKKLKYDDIVSIIER